MISRRLIIGLGSGRCGTVSLRNLLALQEGTCALHEHFILPWETNYSLLYQAMEVLAGNRYPVVAAVASYYLPYIGDISKSLKHFGFQSMSVVVLRRSQAETVSSFLRKTMGRNHWQTNTGAAKDSKWDNSFPKYCSSLKKFEAIERYWRDYYSLCYRNGWPVFSTDCLNSESGQRELLVTSGYQNPVISTGIWANSS